VYLCRNIPLFDSRGALGFPYGFIPPGTDEYEQAKVQSLCMCMCACVFECECVNVLMHYKLFVGVCMFVGGRVLLCPSLVSG
jgi:hypothetical protein